MPILNHASGSANPATSLSALWAYLHPALDHIIKAPATDPNGKAPALDFGLYAGIHSACYNYFTAQGEAHAIPLAPPPPDTRSGPDIYDQLDKYFAEAARELSLAAPIDDIALVQYLVTSFNRYNAGAQSANRLLNYVNRHYVKRAVDEDRGWFRLTDVIETVAKNISFEDSREAISRVLREKKLEELKKWGYPDDGLPEQAAFAESCAEAASPPDRVVPIASLAHRRFRTEVMEPLLATPKIKGNSKAKHKIPKASPGPNPTRPKGRLARAVKELLETDAVDEEERLRLVTGLSKMLQVVGIRSDHLLRKRLDKYVASAPSPPPAATPDAGAPISSSIVVS